MKTQAPQKLLLILTVVAAIFIQPSGVFAQHDTTAYVRIEKPTYFGYEIGAGAEFQKITSNIPQLQQLATVMEGATVGLKLANCKGALRAMGGLYYSGGGVPYTIDMVKAGVSGNLYVLRLNKVVYRTFEPYALVSATYQQTKFFGTYLNYNNKNRSISDEPELGKINWCLASVGAGVEFQLENDKYQFIHFFAEAKYGIPIYTRRSNADFSQTQIKAPLAVTVGMSFGKLK